MVHLALSLLGPFEVMLDGAWVTRFHGDTVQALLAYLAMHPGTTFRREVLAGLLWPDRPEPEALVNLRQALRRLRTATGDDKARPPFPSTADAVGFIECLRPDRFCPGNLSGLRCLTP